MVRFRVRVRVRVRVRIRAEVEQRLEAFAGEVRVDVLRGRGQW